MNHYFSFHHTPTAQNVVIALFHMDDEAPINFNMLMKCEGFQDQRGSARFGSSVFEDPMKTLG